MPSYSRHAVILDTSAEAGSPVTLGATIRLSSRLQAEIERNRTDGSIYARHIAIKGYSPEAEIESFALQDWLDQVGLTGKTIDSDVDNDGLELYFQKFDQDSGPASSGHRSLTIAQGLLVPEKITVSHQDDAQIMYKCLISYDGTNLPIVVDDSATLPTSPADNERFTIGGMTIGGVTVSQITKWELDFGIVARLLGEDSSVYPTRAELRAVNPTISITTTDATIMKSGGIPLNGLACTHANTIMYLRKRTQDATHFVANGTSEHIKVTAYGLAVIDQPDGQQGDDPAEATIRIDCAHDGTNAPVVFDTTSTIS